MHIHGSFRARFINGRCILNRGSERQLKDRIKVLHVVLAMEYGGLERIVNQFARKLDRSVFDLSICCLDRGGEFLDELNELGVKHSVLGRRPGLMDFRVLRALTRYISRNRINVVHSHSGCSLYASIAARLAGAEVIVHTDHGRLMPDRLSLILEDRLSSRLMNAFVAVSRQLADYLVDKVRVPGSKLHVIINGVDTGRFVPAIAEDIAKLRRGLNIPEQAEVVGTVCRLDPVKNLGSMILAMGPMLKERTGMIVLITGDGPEKGHLERLAGELNLNGRIRFLGKRNDIERIMPVLDVFVLPSISEGTSMTMLEAMACGIPVVASAVGGNTDLVEENANGYLFPLERTDLMCARILDLLEGAERRRAFGLRSRFIAEKRYSVSAMMEAYSNLYLNSFG